MSPEAVIDPPEKKDQKPADNVVNVIDPPTGKTLPTADERDKELGDIFKMGEKPAKDKTDDTPPEPKPVKDDKTPAPAPEPKPAPAPDGKTTDTPPAPEPVAVESDSPELKSLLEAPIPTKNPKTAVEMNAYKEKWAGHVRTVEKRLKDVETQLQTKLAELGDQIKAKETQIEELSGYRLAVDFQADPKFIETHEKPLNEKKEEIRAFMKQNGIGEGGMAHLETVWDNQVQLLAIANQLGEQSQEVGELFRDHLRELRGVQKGHDKAIREAVTKRADLIKQRRESSSKELAEREAGFNSRFQECVAMKNGVGEGAPPKFAFLHKLPVPAGATPEQVEQIQAHNQRADEETRMVNSLARSASPGELMDMAILTRSFPYMLNTIKDLQGQLKAAQDQLTEINKAGSFSKKAPASGGDNPPPPTNPNEVKSGGEVFDEQFKGTFR